MKELFSSYSQVLKFLILFSFSHLAIASPPESVVNQRKAMSDSATPAPLKKTTVEGIEFTPLAQEIPGSEGPLTTLDGRTFLVAPSKGSILELLPDGSLRELANTGGIPAGLQLHTDGSIWVADMKLGILRVTLDGKIEDVVREFEGQPIRGCNDCYFDSLGNLYFTAPAGSSADKLEGELFCRLTDGTVKRLDRGFAFCNGLAVSANDRRLIVAETHTKRLYLYEIQSPGVVGPRQLWATLPGDHRGGPDGLDFDVDGNLIATNWGGGHLEIYNPAGELTRRIALPFSKPSNVHFTSPQSTELLVTEHEFQAIWKFDYGTSGQRQFGWPK